jgi:hypothetical protein
MLFFIFDISLYIQYFLVFQTVKLNSKNQKMKINKDWYDRFLLKIEVKYIFYETKLIFGI